jgi:hypothetical protein
MAKRITEKRIHYLIIFFMVALSISGLTAIPLAWEVGILRHYLGAGTWLAALWPAMAQWIEAVYKGITTTAITYPFYALWHRLAGFCTCGYCHCFYWASA